MPVGGGLRGIVGDESRTRKKSGDTYFSLYLRDADMLFDFGSDT